MGELIDRDQEHLRLIEIAFYIQAGLIGFVAMFASIYIFLGMIVLSLNLPKTGPNDPPVQLIGGVLITIGVIFFALGIGFAGLLLYAGRGIRARKRRILAMVLAGFCCLQMPWGTVFGVLSIIVLNRPSVSPLFEGPPALH
jgi:hypothetical protein